MVSSIANLVYELSSELLDNLRLRILGKKKILGKYQIWVEPSAQSLFHKLNFGNSSQKKRKSRCQTFLYLSSFTGFLYFAPNVLPRIVWANKVLVLTLIRLGFLRLVLSGENQFDTPPPSSLYFKKNLSNINITLYKC